MTRPIALITGAGTGIGQAIAIRLYECGYFCILAYNQSKDGVNTTLQRIEHNGESIQLNIGDENSVKQVFEQIINKHNTLNVVINNAGIGSMGLMKDITTEEYERVFNTNCKGTFFMCRAAAQCISDGGRIINLSTGLTKSSQPGMALYTASKLAVEGFTKALAHELGARQITVNTVSPGMTNTPMLEGGDADMLRKIGAATSVMKRLGEPSDIANAIALLVSPDAQWITGQNIHVDGGSVIL